MLASWDLSHRLYKLLAAQTCRHPSHPQRHSRPWGRHSSECGPQRPPADTSQTGRDKNCTISLRTQPHGLYPTTCLPNKLATTTPAGYVTVLEDGNTMLRALRQAPINNLSPKNEGRLCPFCFAGDGSETKRSYVTVFTDGGDRPGPGAAGPGPRYGTLVPGEGGGTGDTASTGDTARAKTQWAGQAPASAQGLRHFPRRPGLPGCASRT